MVDVYIEVGYLPIFKNVGSLYSGSGKTDILNKVVLCSIILLCCINIKLYLEQVKINVRITK